MDSMFQLCLAQVNLHVPALSSARFLLNMSSIPVVVASSISERRRNFHAMQWRMLQKVMGTTKKKPKVFKEVVTQNIMDNKLDEMRLKYEERLNEFNVSIMKLDSTNIMKLDIKTAELKLAYDLATEFMDMSNESRKAMNVQLDNAERRFMNLFDDLTNECRLWQFNYEPPRTIGKRKIKIKRR